MIGDPDKQRPDKQRPDKQRPDKQRPDKQSSTATCTAYFHFLNFAPQRAKITSLTVRRNYLLTYLLHGAESFLRS